MAYKIIEIEGIGPVYAEKLGLANIKTVEGLLEAGKDKSGRKKIAEASGLDEGDGPETAFCACCCSERSKSCTDKLSPSVPINQSAATASA